MLEKALEGAASQGAKTELIHLYDLNFKGCISCFACKTKGGKSYGKCAVEDDLAPVFRKIEKADAIILGSLYHEFVYKCIRPHKSLGLITPLKFLHNNGIMVNIKPLYQSHMY